MVLNAAFLAMLGVGVTFLPQELLIHAGIQPLGTLVLLVQILGAMLIGFATLNWMNRSAHIGGIHRRPVSMANCSHFAIGAVAC